MEFTLQYTFNASAKNIYDAWLSSKLHTAMTGGEAEISSKAYDTFSAWGGYISGANIELQPFKKIKQAWRTVEFAPDQPDSILEITLEEKEPSITLLILRHSNLSDNDMAYKQGWVDSYFEPMSQYFLKH